MCRTVFAIVACFLLLLWPHPNLAARGLIDRFADSIKTNTKLSMNTCQSESGATRADLESLKMRKIPETKTGRCFMECLFNSVKLMDDGKFNKQGMIIAFTPAMKGDLGKISKLRSLSEVCDRQIGGKKFQNCEGAKKIVECVARNGKEYGIEFPRDKKM